MKKWKKTIKRDPVTGKFTSDKEGKKEVVQWRQRKARRTGNEMLVQRLGNARRDRRKRNKGRLLVDPGCFLCTHVPLLPVVREVAQDKRTYHIQEHARKP